MTVQQSGAEDATKEEVPVHTRAAQGDGEAHSILADAHYRRAEDGSVPRVLALGHATIYARMASMARGERNDWLSLIFLLENYACALREAGQTSLADNAQAEAVVYRKLSARPRHHAQDDDAIPAFKKTSPPKWRRSGQRSRRAHR